MTYGCLKWRFALLHRDVQIYGMKRTNESAQKCSVCILLSNAFQRKMSQKHTCKLPIIKCFFKKAKFEIIFRCMITGVASTKKVGGSESFFLADEQ